MQKEIWKPIEGWEGLYEVSNSGKVRSWKPNQGQELPRTLNVYEENGKKFSILNKYSTSGTCRFNITKNLPKYFPVNNNNED